MGPQTTGVFLFYAALFAFYVGTIIWAYSDAKARGKSGLFIALAVALACWPLGLIIWSIIGPRTRA